MASNASSITNKNGVASSSISEISGLTLSEIDEVNGIAIESVTLYSSSFSFDDQTTAITSSGNGWAPSGTHSGWANGPSAVVNGKSGGVWLSSSQTPQDSSLSSSSTVTGWRCDYNATGSSSTGPSGAMSGNGGHSTLTTTKYVFTETSSGLNAYHHVMRTPGINFNQVMGNTSNTLELKFWVHAYGSNMGDLFIYIDDAATSNDANATLLAKMIPFNNPTFTATSHSQVSPTTASWTTNSSNWVQVTVNLGNYKTVNSTHYIYFVMGGAGGFRADMAIDQVEFVES